MAKPMAMLRVATNPFSAIDHEGRPSGACPIDPEDPRFFNPRKGLGDVRGRVGARLVGGDVTREVSATDAMFFRTERRDIAWEFERLPFLVHDTRFYRRQIAEGTLIDASKNYEAARLLAKARAQCAVEPRWI